MEDKISCDLIKTLLPLFLCEGLREQFHNPPCSGLTGTYSKGPQIVGRDPNLGRETFDPGSRNNLNLHFKFSFLIRQNKCNHLLFCVLRFI